MTEVRFLYGLPYLGRLSKALKRAGQLEKATEFCDKAKASKSYDEELQLCFDYVEVK